MLYTVGLFTGTGLALYIPSGEPVRGAVNGFGYGIQVVVLEALFGNTGYYVGLGLVGIQCLSRLGDKIKEINIDAKARKEIKAIDDSLRQYIGQINQQGTHTVQSLLMIISRYKKIEKILKTTLNELEKCKSSLVKDYKSSIQSLETERQEITQALYQNRILLLERHRLDVIDRMNRFEFITDKNLFPAPAA